MFTVTLHHLAPDVKKAGVEYPDVEISLGTPDRLRGLIAAVAKLAATDHLPARPELRIVAPHGRFVIHAADGRLRFNSWSVRVGGADLNAEQIFAIVTGADVPDTAAEAEAFMREARGSRRRKLMLIVAVVLATNAATAWMTLRPPPVPLLAEYRLLDPDPAARLLADAAGDYQTGANEGDRAMKITRDGRVHWVKFGLKGAIAEESDLTAKAAESRGHAALFTDANGLIDIVDGSTVVFFGDTYRRKTP